MKISQALKFIAVATIVALKGATANVPVVDTAGHSQLDLLVQMGTTDVGLSALKVQESDAENGPFTDVPKAPELAPLPAASDGGKLFRISVDLLGRKRYMKLVATAPAASGGANFSVLGILTEGRITPSDAPSRGLAGEIFV